jgi:protein TonB
MNDSVHNPATQDLLVYDHPDRRGGGWLAVVTAAAGTAMLFLLLPFTELMTVHEPATLRAHEVELVAAPVKPPEPPQLKPPEPRERPEVSPAPRPRPSPAPAPAEAPRPSLDLTIPLDLGVTVQSDFSLNLAMSPVRVPPLGSAPPAPPPPAPDVFTVDDLDHPPRPILRIPPVYPYRARSRNLEGHVTLQFMVRTDGGVEQVEVVESEPAAVFSSAAVKAVERWRFEPGTRQGQVVPVRVQVTLRFDIE